MSEPTPAETADALRKRFRLCLVLGKFRVIERNEASMKVALGGSTTMTVPLPPNVDVNAGDLLTLYTEILYANPVKPPL